MYSASLGKMLENISKLIYLRVSKMIFSDYRRIWPWALRVYHKIIPKILEQPLQLYLQVSGRDLHPYG
jgi:hypothetical protein